MFDNRLLSNICSPVHVICTWTFFSFLAVDGHDVPFMDEELQILLIDNIVTHTYTLFVRNLASLKAAVFICGWLLFDT